MANDRPGAAGEGSRDILAQSRKPIAAPLFRTRECTQFAELFESLQRETGQIVPPRKSLTPALARGFLPYVSIFEIREPRLALVRLVGTAIVNRTHIDNTGRNMMDLFPPEARDWCWNHFMRVIGTPCGSTFLVTEDYEHTSIPIEVLSFPLNDSDGTPRFIASISIEVDRQQLALRGEQAMQISELGSYHYIDIGNGT